MDFFSLLCEHSRTRTETLAVSSPRRSMTYRKLWSRIERATARLQQEWRVSPGDVVAYCGDSHPDALVLFFALARCGARLLPLSPSLSSSDLHFLTQEIRPRLLLGDDELVLARQEPLAAFKPLSDLIATRCPEQATDLLEDPHTPTLLWCADSADVRKTNSYSLAQLCESDASSPPAGESQVSNLLEPAVLAHTVLPALRRGTCIVVH